MVVYQFRIVSEDIEELLRVIQIKATQSFLDFHLAIQEAIGFDATKEAYFHNTTDNWRVESVICSTEKGHSKLEKTILNKQVFDPHQKFIYITDDNLEWTFHIELVRLLKADSSSHYPKCIKKEGENPKQYKNPHKLGANPTQDLFDEAEQLIADQQSDDLDDLHEIKPE